VKPSPTADNADLCKKTLLFILTYFLNLNVDNLDYKTYFCAIIAKI
jgi:hypothetical protein